MKTLELSLRLNSPAFAGAVQKGTQTMEVVKGRRGEERIDPAEPGCYPCDPFGLRIPAVRGVLEFWYRTLLGAQSHSAVYQEQGRIFGSTELGQGLGLRYAGRPEFQSGELEAPKQFRQAFLYLGYGPIQTFKVPKIAGRPIPNLLKYSSYSPFGLRDAIEVSEGKDRGVFRFIATGTEHQLEALRRASILLHLFGGIGSRSRRGWGSVRAEADFIPALPSAAALDAQVLELWERVAPDRLPRERPRFSAFGPGCRLFRTPPLAGGYGAVLEEFYRRFEATRLWQTSGSVERSTIAQEDHDLEARDAHGARLSALPRRLAFGMPYSPHFRDRSSISYAQDSHLNDRSSDSTGRRASPLFLKVHRLENGDHVGLALLLNGAFLGGADETIGVVGKRERLEPPDDYEAIHEFLSPTDKTPSRHQLDEWTEIKLPGI